MTTYTPTYQLQGDELAVFTTSKGEICVKLDCEGAPIHAANFCELTINFYVWHLVTLVIHWCLVLRV